MESERFDRMIAGMAKASDRRAAMKGLAAALAGVGIARAAAPAVVEADEVETERCGGKRDRCFRNTDCCRGLKCKGADDYYNESGNCVFKNGHGGKGDWCKKDSDCDNRFECRNKKCR
ncbi:MAG: hypothetical protein ACKOWF_03730 [Chloroflexota bacterium]